MTEPAPSGKPRRPVTAAGVLGAMLLGLVAILLQDYFQSRFKAALAIAVLAVIVSVVSGAVRTARAAARPKRGGKVRKTDSSSCPPVRLCALLAAAFALAGCGGMAAGYNWVDAREAQMKGDYARCARRYGSSADYFQAKADKIATPRTKEEGGYFNLLAVSLVGRARCLTALDRADEARADYKRVVLVADKVLNEGLPAARAGSYYGSRAEAHKVLGNLRQAVGDQEKHVADLNAYCQGGSWEVGTGGVKDKTCNSVADEAERLAQWKKELAAKP